MNDAPPPLSPQGISPAKEGGGGKVILGCGFGCLVVVILCVVGIFVGLGILKSKVTGGIDTFTADQPIVIEAPDVTQSEIDDAVTRFDTFSSAMKAGETPAPLLLSENDLNAILFNHPDFKDLAGKTKFAIRNDRLSSTVSIDLDELEIPIKFIADAVDGKFFNGDVTLSIDMVADRPVVFVEELSVNGAPLPEMVMQEFKKENLVKDLQDDPKMSNFFDKIQELKIENDQLKIVPKSE